MRSSAASSIVTTRSPAGMKAESAASVVVLPLPVPPRDEQVAPGPHGRASSSSVSASSVPSAHEVVARQRLRGEAPDRERRAVERERRDDGVDPGAVGEPRVHHRARLVHPASRAGTGSGR